MRTRERERFTCDTSLAGYGIFIFHFNTNMCGGEGEDIKTYLGKFSFYSVFPRLVAGYVGANGLIPAAPL